MKDKLENHLPGRRAFLRNALLAIPGASLLPGLVEAQNAPATDPKSPYAPWRMGIQSYSLRAFKTDDMLAKTAALGLRYVEAYPEHFPLTDDPKTIAGYKEQLKAHNLVMPAYGAIDFSADAQDARKKFEFAKAMGIRTLTSNPAPDSFEVLDKLVQEYNIRIAIHNHGPDDARYGKIDQVSNAIQGHNALIGACVDTGHYLRADESPVTAVGKFGTRVFDVHLKNVKQGPGKEKVFTEIGEIGGLLDVVAILRILKENHFRGLLALEYEEHEQDPIPYIKQCLEATRRSIDTVNHIGLRPGNA